jgi:hypothetical protein
MLRPFLLHFIFPSLLTSRHRNPPGQGYPTGVLTLPYSGSQGQRSLLTRPVTLPVTLPGSGQGTLQGRIEIETVYFFVSTQAVHRGTRPYSN